jgi:hypothetical protein
MNEEVGMLARVVCHKCKKDLKIKNIIPETIGIVIVVECCNHPECLEQKTKENPEYEKHLSDMLRVNPPDDSFMGKDI